MAETCLNYIDGQWIECASRKTFESCSPATGEVVAWAQDSKETDVQNAVIAARSAFDNGSWSSLAGKDRALILNQFADLMEENIEALAKLIAHEMGKPYRTAVEREVYPSIDRVRFFAGAARMIRGEVTESAPAHLLNIVRKRYNGCQACFTLPGVDAGDIQTD